MAGARGITPVGPACGGATGTGEAGGGAGSRCGCGCSGMMMGWAAAGTAARSRGSNQAFIARLLSCHGEGLLHAAKRPGVGPGRVRLVRNLVRLRFGNLTGHLVGFLLLLERL